MGMLVGTVLLDLKTWRIPNSYIVSCSITAVFLLMREMGVWGCFIFLGRFLWPILLLYGVYLMGGLGAGDIKLLGVISTLMSSRIIIRLIVMSMVIGAAYGVFRWIKSGQLMLRCREICYQGFRCFHHEEKIHFYALEQGEEEIHFAVCIFIAYIFCICKEGAI